MRRTPIAASIALVALLGSCLTSIADPASGDRDGGAGQSGAAGSAGAGAGGNGGSTNDASAGASGSGATGGAGGTGAAPIVVVHQGSSSLSGISAEASFPAVDPNKAALFMGRVGDSQEPDKLLVDGALTSATTATFSRFEALGTSALVRWYVVEHEHMFVQRGSLNLTSTSQLVSLPTSVDPTRAFSLVSYKAGGTQMGGNDFVSAKLLAGDSLELRAGDVPVMVSWQVVELTDGSRVVSKAATLPSDQSTISVTIDPVDLGRSFLLFSYRLGSNPSLTTPENAALRGRLSAANTVSFDRAAAGPLAIEIELSVVELSVGSVAHVPIVLAAGESSTSAPTTARPATGIAFATAYGWSGSSQFATTDAYAESFIAAALEPGQVTVTRGAFDQAMNADLEIVDFAP